ncbi:MAG: LPXTG cell wall anchor domain-containing protein, partial [Oscillospiraceae bacterium]
TITELKAVYKDGMVTFETDHFSKFAIATAKNPQTSDATPIIPLMALVTIAGATLVITKKSKKIV